ncbi:ECF RNA polymerase sigma factor SigW [Planctomycetales bacterium 10988]|nr:ECF RNA polymerase sigma factor SigW [Planctomycetales bacterium 10988]
MDPIVPFELSENLWIQSIALYMKDEQTAWVQQTAPRALAYAISLVRDRTIAEDLVQDCYQRLLSRADRYDLRKDGTKLLFKSITNACINWTQRKQPTISFEDLPSQEMPEAASHEGPPEHAIKNELAGAVHQALGKLPVDQRAAMELHVLGYAANEIAGILETTAGNARVLLHRARQQLASELETFLKEV